MRLGILDIVIVVIAKRIQKYTKQKLTLESV